MKKKSKKENEQLATLKKRQAQIAEQIQQVEARKRESERKQFNRAKYMIGGMFFKAFASKKISDVFCWKLLRGFGNKKDIKWLLDYEFINPEPKLSLPPAAPVKADPVSETPAELPKPPVSPIKAESEEDTPTDMPS